MTKPKKTVREVLEKLRGDFYKGEVDIALKQLQDILVDEINKTYFEMSMEQDSHFEEIKKREETPEMISGHQATLREYGNRFVIMGQLKSKIIRDVKKAIADDIREKLK